VPPDPKLIDEMRRDVRNALDDSRSQMEAMLA
jgi:hypothetical protein